MPRLAEGTTPSVLIRFPRFFHQSAPNHALSYTLRIWFGRTNFPDAPGVIFGVENVFFLQRFRNSGGPPLQTAGGTVGRLAGLSTFFPLSRAAAVGVGPWRQGLPCSSNSASSQWAPGRVTAHDPALGGGEGGGEGGEGADNCCQPVPLAGQCQSPPVSFKRSLPSEHPTILGQVRPQGLCAHEG